MAAIAPRLVSALRRRLRPKRLVQIFDEGDLVELAHWTERTPLRLNVPVGMLRMQGGYTYGPGHPFVQGLTEGVSALERFYASVQPETICDYYGIEGHGRTGHDLPPWEIPWYLRRQRAAPPGELNLGAQHGVSFYGPVTPEKVDLEYKRLTGLRDAVQAKGYDPDGHGDVEGYILRDGARACFFVRGGKHRAAVLTALGETHVPVGFRASFPRIVDRAQARTWPLVRSGQIDRKLARAILRVYVAGRTVEEGPVT